MLKLNFCKVLQHAQPVFIKLTNEAGDIEKSVDAVTQREVVSFSQYRNSMREGALTTDCFLESGTCGSATVNFSIKKANVDELGSESKHVWSHYFRGICSCKTPNDIASSVSDVSANAVISQINVIHKCFFQYWDKTHKSSW